MGLNKRVFGVLLAILAGVAGSGAAEACYEYAFSYRLPHLHKVSIIIQGRPVATRHEGLVRTFAVERTYKGPVRKRWTVVGPLSSKWPVPAHVSGEPRFERVLAPSSYIVGIEKLDRPHHERIRQRLEKLGIQAEYMAIGGDGGCWKPFYFAATKSLISRIALATGQLGSEDDAERERLLRHYFDFRVHEEGLQHAVLAARIRLDAFVRRHGHTFDAAGILSDISAHTLQVSRSQMARTDRQARENPQSWLRQLSDNDRTRVTQHHLDLMWLLKALDRNGDQAVDRRELRSAIADAFSFYDKNNNGIADDFDEN